MNVTARVRIIILKNEALHLNVKYGGPAKDLVSEPGWRGAVREGIDSAGKVKPVSSQQPTPFSLLSLGHLFWGKKKCGFYYLQERCQQNGPLML